MGEGWDGGGKKRLTSIFLLQPAIEGYYTLETRGGPPSDIPYSLSNGTNQVLFPPSPPVLSRTAKREPACS